MPKRNKPAVNIRKILDASRDSAAEREKPVSVSILVDTTADDAPVQTIRRSFVPATPQGHLSVAPYRETTPDVDEESDVVVVVAGDSPVTGELYAQCAARDVPCVVVGTSMTRVLERAEESGGRISALDVVVYAGGDEDSVDRFLLSLGNWIVDACRSSRVALAATFPFLRRSLAYEVVKATSFQNGIIGAVTFIPGADMPIMTLNQAKMILQIAAAYGEGLGLERLKELAVVVGGGFALRAAARQLVGLVPALGWAVKGGVGYSGTLAIGMAALAYFGSGCSVSGLSERISAARDKAVEQDHLLADKRKVVRDVSRRARERVDVDLVSVSDAISGAINERRQSS